MSAKAARESLIDVAIQMRGNGQTYVKAARVWRDIRDERRRSCACRRCRLLRGGQVKR